METCYHTLEVDCAIVHVVENNFTSSHPKPLCFVGNAGRPMIAGHYTRNCCPQRDVMGGAAAAEHLSLPLSFASVGAANRLASWLSLSHNDEVAIRNGPCKNYLVWHVWHAEATSGHSQYLLQWIGNLGKCQSDWPLSVSFYHKFTNLDCILKIIIYLYFSIRSSCQSNSV